MPIFYVSTVSYFTLIVDQFYEYSYETKILRFHRYRYITNFTPREIKSYMVKSYEDKKV